MADWKILIYRYCYEVHHGQCEGCSFTYYQFEAWLKKHNIAESAHRAERALRELAGHGLLDRRYVRRRLTGRRTTVFYTTSRICSDYQDWLRLWLNRKA
jgi:hypothetical protein